MPEMSRLGARYDTTYRDSRGRRVTGRFVAVPESNPTQVVPQKRLFRTPANTILRPGDILLDLPGTRYLLAEGPAGVYRQEVVKRTFRCIELDHHLQWTRRTARIDPVMKVEIDDAVADLGLIWCNVDPRDERLERSSKVASSYEKFKLYTNAPLQIDDKVGDYLIVRVEKVAGVIVADAQ